VNHGGSDSAGPSPVVSAQQVAPAPAAPQLTIKQQQAKQAAEAAIASLPFSQSGLVEFLVYQGHSEEDATYAVEQLKEDWDAQADKAAAEYVATQRYTHNRLQEQLEYAGFRPSEAAHGVRSVGL